MSAMTTGYTRTVKILIACPIKDRAWAIPYWYAGIEANALHPDFNEVTVAALVSPSEDRTEEALEALGVEILHDSEPGRPPHEIDGHMWGVIGKFEYMARLRNRLVDFAIQGDFDYLFSLDSDIVLPAHGLEQLLYFSRTHPGVVAPSVNMAQGHGVVWNVMNWSNPVFPGLVNRETAPEAGQADVVMAAMLLDRSALECRWEAHMAGEDIGFCLQAEELGVKRWWMPEIRCQHFMNRLA